MLFMRVLVNLLLPPAAPRLAAARRHLEGAPNGRWVPLPPRVVLQQLAPDGDNHVCANRSVTIYCFIGGSPTS